MDFRPAQREELPAILALIQQAQTYLKEQGLDQWQDGYPNEKVIARDLDAEHCYVLAHEGVPAATAVISFKPEPCYAVIYEGEWLSPEQPCAVLHRVAVGHAWRGHGLGERLLREAELLCRARGIDDIKVDTHAGNRPMRRMLEKNGFLPRGVIVLENGVSRRVAYEKRGLHPPEIPACP